MTFNIKVEGGTRAGWRTVKQPSKNWTCPTCAATNRYYLAQCGDCGVRRDGDK